MYLSMPFPFLVFFIHLQIHISIQCTFFHLKDLFQYFIFGNVDLLIMNDFSFCMSEKVYHYCFSKIFLLDVLFKGNSFLSVVWDVVELFSCLHVISNDSSLITNSIPFLAAFKNFSFSFVLSSLIVCVPGYNFLYASFEQGL